MLSPLRSLLGSLSSVPVRLPTGNTLNTKGGAPGRGSNRNRRSAPSLSSLACPAELPPWRPPDSPRAASVDGAYGWSLGPRAPSPLCRDGHRKQGQAHQPEQQWQDPRLLFPSVGGGEEEFIESQGRPPPASDKSTESPRNHFYNDNLRRLSGTNSQLRCILDPSKARICCSENLYPFLVKLYERQNPLHRIATKTQIVACALGCHHIIR
jgi:hypothetical protein